MSFVLDASVAIQWCLPHGSVADTRYARRVLDLLDAETAVAPAIWSLEVANVLGRIERQGRISEAMTGTFVAFLDSLDIVIDPTGESKRLSDVMHLGRRHALSAYDAAYLDVAIRTGYPLATLDQELRAAARAAGVADPAGRGA